MQIKEEEHLKGHLCCIEVRLNSGPEMPGQNLLKGSLHFISFVVVFFCRTGQNQREFMREKSHK